MMQSEATLVKLWAQCLPECCSLGVNWLPLLLLHIPGVLGGVYPWVPGTLVFEVLTFTVRSVGRSCGDFKGCLVLDLFQKLGTGIL